MNLLNRQTSIERPSEIHIHIHVNQDEQRRKVIYMNGSNLPDALIDVEVHFVANFPHRFVPLPTHDEP